MAHIEIPLTTGQVRRVVRAAVRANSTIEPLVVHLSPGPELNALLAAAASSPGSSSSLARALRVLAAVPDQDTSLKVIALSAQLPPSSTHRYLRTWAALKAVQQDQRSRLYRRRPLD